ncbi:MAG: Asp-tRNA(Asn)/Glu-tRNA(Gln) amidotransferase subunit GatB [Oscillospiraceae bacterium]|jgi:aspartyl-tRNA(Asn)/glutamyl-tRNA(Gln) amidotransferase subunit B|nr:Asp-tRNA(Asn)/Glu-tRNA(Gln) amidotransferase subunit GatB [Oscillospiraceae bacterium]
MDLDVVIGLEVHVELKTRSKMYCSCKNEFGGVANSHCCEICTGMPGTLPNLNKEAVQLALKAGLALNCEINNRTTFDRKNYFYPDLPKGYQISQNEAPLCVGGFVEILLNNGTQSKKINLVQIHLEEDAGKMIHSAAEDRSFIDFNRSGVPLIEIVSKPELSSAAEMKAYLETIMNTMRYLGVSDCKVEEGSLREDINVSLKPNGSPHLGVRCEIKNVGGINNAARAVECEIRRQTEILESGKEIEPVTLRWDEEANKSSVMRKKDAVVEYRYFQDPDIPVIEISKEEVEEVRKSLGELPVQKVKRLMRDYGLTFTDAGLLAEDQEKIQLFEATAKTGEFAPQKAANWIQGDISRILNEKNIRLSDSKLTPQNLSKMINMIDQNKISNTAAKIIVERLMQEDISPEIVAQQEGLLQLSDQNSLKEIAEAVLAENPQVTKLFQEGKTNILGFAVGECMKRLNGRGNPVLLKEIILDLILTRGEV